MTRRIRGRVEVGGFPTDSILSPKTLRMNQKLTLRSGYHVMLMVVVVSVCSPAA